MATVDIASGELVAQQRRRAVRRHIEARVGLYVAAILAALLAAGPFIWAAITATIPGRASGITVRTKAPTRL